MRDMKAHQSEVLASVLKRITPTEEEKRDTKEKLEAIRSAVRKALRPGLDHVIAGSYTRDTWMRHKKEFDIFILFPEETGREELEREGLELGKEITRSLKGSYEVAYAEHPYTRARLLGYDVDIVPAYSVSDPSRIKSAVDRTPFHNEWLSRFLHNGLSPEVRLLKRFTKAHGLYGSDTRTQGFSGYLCELLIVRYGSFLDLCREAALWEPGREYITQAQEGVLVSIPMDRLSPRLRRKFRGQPLVVIDPVDPNRNVASVLSPANFVRFRSACSGFLGSPSEDHFFPPEFRPDVPKLRSAFKERGTRLLVLAFREPKVIEDILWPQLRRCAERLRAILEGEDFSVLGHSVHSGQGLGLLASLPPKLPKVAPCSYILLELDRWYLPTKKVLEGPSVFDKENAENFKSKYSHAKVWVEKDRWLAEVPREHRQARECLEHALSEPEARLKAKGIPSYLAPEIRKGFAILDTRQALQLARDSAFGQWLTEYLEK